MARTLLVFGAYLSIYKDLIMPTPSFVASRLVLLACTTGLLLSACHDNASSPSPTDTAAVYVAPSFVLTGQSLAVTDAGIADRDGVRNIVYSLMNNSTAVKVEQTSPRFDGLAAGTYTLSTRAEVKNGASGIYILVGNGVAASVSITVEAPADPVPTAPVGSGFAGLVDMTVSDELGGSDIIINAGGVTDSLGREIVYSAVGLPSGLSIDSRTGVISGVYDTPYTIGLGQSEKFNITISATPITAQPKESSKSISKSFVLSIRNDG